LEHEGVVGGQRKDRLRHGDCSFWLERDISGNKKSDRELLFNGSPESVQFRAANVK
jgi:hypothetical protein